MTGFSKASLFIIFLFVCLSVSLFANDQNISICTHVRQPVISKKLGPSHFSHKLEGSFLELIGQEGERAQMAALV